MYKVSEKTENYRSPQRTKDIILKSRRYAENVCLKVQWVSFERTSYPCKKTVYFIHQTIIIIVTISACASLSKSCMLWERGQTPAHFGLDNTFSIGKEDGKKALLLFADTPNLPKFVVSLGSQISIGRIESQHRQRHQTEIG